MPYHIDYRPNTLDEIIGNESIVKSIKSLQDSIPHCLLFYGKSGCGKTTIARIIALDLLKCSDHDYTEINTSNNRGIDTARDIMRTMHYSPMNGKSKVIVFDEVHQSTKDFQNALLKALEDTPKHVYFILCTTDPQKLLPTIRNRCMTFEVRSLNDSEMLRLLEEVMSKENKTVGAGILNSIMTKAEGCSRQALIMLEQIINLDPKDRRKAIQNIKTQEEKIIDLCRALLAREKWERISSILKSIEDEPESIRRAVLGYINSVALNSKKTNDDVYYIYESFKYPFYDTGKAGLTFACYEIINS